MGQFDLGFNGVHEETQPQKENYWKIYFSKISFFSN